ncbi:MAG: hypothetical protein HZB80_03045 [Deltaproteobacteria bacterium]|nr:hypothetical protein [Deltaproteobacteria bacterium]
MAKNNLSRVYKLGEADTAPPVLLDLAAAVMTDEFDRDRLAGVNALAEIERDAYEKGFAAGERAGMELGMEKINLEIKRLLSIIEELLYFKEKFYADKEKELIELIITTAKKVVHAELSVNRNVVINVIKAAIDAMTASEKLCIRLNPDDMEYLMQAKPDFLKNMENVRGFVVEGDAYVGRGGCVIEGSHGEVDARIEQGLKTIEKEALEVLKK